MCVLASREFHSKAIFLAAVEPINFSLSWLPCLPIQTPCRWLETAVAEVQRVTSTYLIRCLFREHSLEQHLVALKSYFLLDQGDFVVAFLDGAEAELSKPAKDVSQYALQVMLCQLGMGSRPELQCACVCVV
jgi:Gamma tubulin complex component C-terminal